MAVPFIQIRPIFASVILCIDTAIDRCTVALCRNGELEASATDDSALRASEMLHLMIDQLLKSNNLVINDLKAVAVNGGPGSYTGLRIGATAAKGICYALNIPLIHLDGLRLLKEGIVDRRGMRDFDYYVPMVDARRKEVFTAVIQADDHLEMLPQPVILEPDSFSRLAGSKTIFFGNGAKKASEILNPEPGFTFIDHNTVPEDFAAMVQLKWEQNIFEDYVTYVPNYLKKFFLIASRNK